METGLRRAERRLRSLWRLATAKTTDHRRARRLAWAADGRLSWPHLCAQVVVGSAVPVPVAVSVPPTPVTTVAAAGVAVGGVDSAAVPGELASGSVKLAGTDN